MYDSNTGFGLYGTSAFGTREGQVTPLAKVDNVRPLCMDFYKNGFCNRRGPHNQGCLFRHDEIEGQPGKIESADKKDMSREVVVFKAEAIYGWNATNAVVKLGFSDLAKAAREWAKKKDAEAAAQAAAAAAAAAAVASSATAAAAAAAPAAAALPAGWKEAKAPDGRTYYFHVETKETKWTKPVAPSATLEPPLPIGWKEARAPDGRVYYFHVETKETKWTRPAEPADAAAALAAAPEAAPADAPAADGAAAAPAAAADGAASADADAPADAAAVGACAGANGAHDDEPPTKRTRQAEAEE